MPKRMTLSDVRQRDDLAKAADKMLSTPDFAFPATVASNARKIYDDALEARLPVTALRAAMQWNVAESLITPDSISAGLQLYDRLEQRLPQPYAALAALLKARLLSNTYLSRRYIYDQRTLDDDDASANEPMLWSGNRFRNEITALAQSAMRQKSLLEMTPLKDIAPLLSDTKEGEQAGMTAFDFVCYQVAELLIPIRQSGTRQNNAAIPFINPNDSSDVAPDANAPLDRQNISPVGVIDTLISANLLRGKTAAGALLTARLKRLQLLDSPAERSEYMGCLLEWYPQPSPERPTVVATLLYFGVLPMGTPKEKSDSYNIVQNTVDAYPAAALSCYLKESLESMRRPYIEISNDGQLLPGRPASIACRISNTRDCYILLVPMEASMMRGQSRLQKQIAGRSSTVLKHITSNASFPFELNDSISIPPLEPGYYAIVPSSSKTLAGRYATLDNQELDIINVSGISVFTTGCTDSSMSKPGNKAKVRQGYLYVTDACTGAPVKGAKVGFFDRFRQNTPVGAELFTDADGKVPLNLSQARVSVSYGKSNLVKDYYLNQENMAQPRRYVADILTDLALYHPGDLLRYVTVVARNNDNILSPASSVKVNVSLCDANGKEVAVDCLDTDNSGRASGSFRIPSDGMTGSFRLSAKLAADSVNKDSDAAGILGTQWVEVADYKAPTFRITLDKIELEGNQAHISGNVLTYAGMPLGDTEVTLSIRFNRRWWRFMSDDSSLPDSYSTHTVTDAHGRFAVSLGISDLYGSPYENGYFVISATATGPDGETVSGNGSPFAIAEGLHLSLDDLTTEVTADSITIPVSVVNAVGQPADSSLRYRITDNADDAVIAEGEASAPAITIPAALLPSGQYTVMAALPGARGFNDTDRRMDSGELRNDSIAKMTLTLWRRNDSRPPSPTPLWIPQQQIYATAGKSSVAVSLGSAYPDSRIFYQTADCDSVIACGWIDASDRNVTLNVPAPGAGNEMEVTFRAEHDLDARIAAIKILSAERKNRLRFITDTFRDRISPLSQESWRFRMVCITPADTLLSGHSAVMAVLSNAALNAITPFNWSINPSRVLSYPVKGNIRTTSDTYYNWYNGLRGFLKYERNRCRFSFPQIPEWNFWDQSDRPHNLRTVMIRGSYNKSSAPTGGASLDNMLVKECYDDSCAEGFGGVMERAVMTGATDSGIQQADMDDSSVTSVPLRDTSCPLAFFRPLLYTDAYGMVEISFDVPDFNTTWSLQLIGYDKHMLTTSLQQECVASKPVMISTNMPRFLLTGDKTAVAATMFNNSDESMALSGTIEIFDINTGKVLARGESSGIDVAPAANAPVSVCFDVPSECQALGVRAMVRCEAGSDGEQQMIQVLPSSQPVAEATSFYLLPSEKTLTVDLPKMGKDDKVTLNYCANPAWYVLTSLSGLIEADSESTLSNLNALYASSVASGIMRRYPSLRDALESLFASDDKSSLLTSPLEKNANLKITSLNATPWVNNAESETTRMHSLSSLADTKRAADIIAASVSKLKKNQKSDGGFAWMPQMESSLWISLNVIDCAARISESGYLPEDSRWTDMLKSTLAYTDAEIGNEYHRTVTEYKSKYPLESEVAYFLNRGILGASAPKGWLKDMHADMKKRLPHEWRDLSIADKAAAARLLARTGDAPLAREILASVREFASYKSDKGMWFDNLKEDYGAMPPKVVTADCLTAFNEVMPGDSAITEMCRYLVLSRQGEDWNTAMTPAAVTATVNALLACDLGWTSIQTPSSPRIRIDGHDLTLPSGAEALTGNVYLDLSAKQASGKRLEISRSDAVPAWGAVLRQYVAPAASVSAQAMPQLGVTKQLLPIEIAQDGEKAMTASTKFRKGELIRVTLTLVSDRDLDYVLVNDRRGAFMQPESQLTSYTLENGLWILRETRDSATNFYITHLPKGQYIISYDVYADRDGEYSTGIATAQSQYYPMITAHSAGCVVKVN